jgi:hypothetical protein
MLESFRMLLTIGSDRSKSDLGFVAPKWVLRIGKYGVQRGQIKSLS